MEFTHFDDNKNAVMVDVSEKDITNRVAIATGRITLCDEAMQAVMGKKIKKGEFTFNDFISQLESVKKLGNMKNLIGMIPGLSGMANQIKDIDLENSIEIKHIKAMIDSMTPKERENPDLLNNSRKRRLAIGAGISQIEVNRFLKQFTNASKIAKRFSNGKSLRNLASMVRNKSVLNPE